MRRPRQAKSSRRAFGFLLAILPGLPVVTLNAHANSLTLPAIADTSLFEVVPDNNLGASTSLVVGANGSGLRGRELIRFDLAGQIPTNAVIQSVALTVDVVTVPGTGTVVPTCDLHRMLVDWTEGTGSGMQGNAANPGESTWNNRHSPSMPWKVPGAGISNDFSASVSASTVLTNLGTYTFAATANLVADVQQWLQNPATNFGWISISESEAVPFSVRRLGSRESTNSSPLLTIQYAGPPLVIQGLQRLGGQIQFNFNASAGQTYAVQYTDDLNTNSWVTLTNIPAQSIATNVVIFDPDSASHQRFYRIETTPSP